MKTASVNGIDLAYVDRGAGDPIVLVHGFPLDHSMWNHQIEALSAEYRVIAPDLRGFGKSALTEDAATRETVTMGRFADDLAALLDILGIDRPITLAGLSMGGYVALHFWREHAARLSRLILCDTRAAGDTREVAHGRREAADRVLEEGPATLVDGMTARLFAESTVVRRPEVIESIRRVMMATDPRGIAAALRGMAQRDDMVRELRKIDCPTLVIVGSLDVISTPDEMRGIAETIPNAQFVEIPDCGHMSAVEKPEEVNRAFLKCLRETP